jgi:hypothetical protein
VGAEAVFGADMGHHQAALGILTQAMARAEWAAAGGQLLEADLVPQPAADLIGGRDGEAWALAGFLATAKAIAPVAMKRDLVQGLLERWLGTGSYWYGDRYPEHLAFNVKVHTRIACPDRLTAILAALAMEADDLWEGFCQQAWDEWKGAWRALGGQGATLWSEGRSGGWAVAGRGKGAALDRDDAADLFQRLAGPWAEDEKHETREGVGADELDPILALAVLQQVVAGDKAAVIPTFGHHLAYSASEAWEAQVDELREGLWDALLATGGPRGKADAARRTQFELALPLVYGEDALPLLRTAFAEAQAAGDREAFLAVEQVLAAQGLGKALA